MKKFIRLDFIVTNELFSVFMLYLVQIEKRMKRLFVIMAITKKTEGNVMKKRRLGKTDLCVSEIIVY